MANRVEFGGLTRVEFDPRELFVRGGDYGAVELMGVTEAACLTIDQIVATARLTGRQPRIILSVEYDDTPPPVVENWYAGREGTPEGGVGADDAQRSEPGGEEGVATEEPVGGQPESRP